MPRPRPEATDHDWIMAEAERLKALGETEPRLARDPVNQPMINNWLEALGETDPRFVQGEAPPAMAQVWTMYGLDPTRPEGDPLHGAMQMLDAAGFESVLGTNCDQTYERYLEVGEQVSITTRLESVVGPKQTGVGEGYFVTTENCWWVERVPTASWWRRCRSGCSSSSHDRGRRFRQAQPTMRSWTVR